MNARKRYQKRLSVNAARGRQVTVAGYSLTGSDKHDHYRDFGWPVDLTFNDFYRMFCRNSIASAVVDRMVSKVWQTNPRMLRSADDEQPDEEIERRMTRIRGWRAFADADRRAMVGRYSAVLMRLADGKPWDQPVDRVPGGVDGLLELIPAWQSQLIPVMWDMAPTSPDYGKPLMYQFNEAAITDTINAAPRQFAVHPDRVLIWSADGTTHGRSELEPIYNDLLDIEKIKGAGGEGFWKTSRGAPMIEAPEGMDPGQLAQAMGVSEEGLRSAVNDQLDDFQSGFDKGLMLGGMKATPLQITLPSPEHFFAAPIGSVAAQREMPLRILMGSQSGERASTEDAKAWALTCKSRQTNYDGPLLREWAERMERFGIFPKHDWVVEWDDLTESTGAEKMDRALRMAEVNAKAAPGDDRPFWPDEIREAAGLPKGAWHDEADDMDDIDEEVGNDPNAS